jgi:hypothetical protein
VRQKVALKIKEIIKREEEAAKKQVEEENDIDEEWMNNILNSKPAEQDEDDGEF